MRPLNTVTLFHDEELGQMARACLRNLPVRIVSETLPSSRPAQTLTPDLVLAEACSDREGIERLIAHVKSLWPSVMVALIHMAPKADMLISALHAGLDEFIVPPMEAELPAAIERISAKLVKQAAAGPPLGKLIGFANCKGGCGATTVACHVAVALQRAALGDVLLADLDCGPGLVGFFTRANTKYSVVDAARNTHRLDRSYWKALVSNYLPGLDVLPGPGLMTLEQPSPDQFRDVFRLVRPAYRWMITDLGRGLNPISVTLLDDIDELFLVCTADPAAIFLGSQLLARLRELRFPYEHIHLTLNRFSEQHGPSPEQVAAWLGIEVDAQLPDCPEMDDVYTDSKPSIHKSPLSKHTGGITSGLLHVSAAKPTGWHSLLRISGPVQGGA